jgi:putative component of membrane protein insertase Oxa1/YidC/SpoIIIJ protein YidD
MLISGILPAMLLTMLLSLAFDHIQRYRLGVILPICTFNCSVSEWAFLFIADKGISNRWTSAMMRVIQADVLNPRGLRNVIE